MAAQAAQANSACSLYSQGSPLPPNSLQGLQKSWDAYVAKVNQGQSIQPQCEPLSYSPKSNVPYKGVVVLIHGFLQCPNRFAEEAKALSAQGYEVLLPLLPGHGEAGNPSPVSSMPQGGANGQMGVKGYLQLACDMDTVLASAPKVPNALTLIGGHSTGGSLAVAAAEQSKMPASSRFKCASGKTIETKFNGLLLYSPILKPSTSTLTSLAQAAVHLPNVPLTEKKPDPGCAALKLGANGIGGTCNNIPASVYGATFDLGYYAYDNRAFLENIPMQVVTAGKENSEGDGTVNNEANIELANADPCAQICDMPAAQHDYFTNPAIDPNTKKIDPGLTGDLRTTAANCASDFFGAGRTCATTASGHCELAPRQTPIYPASSYSGSSGTKNGSAATSAQ